MKQYTSLYRRLYGRTLREMAREYGVSLSTVYQWHRRGTMPEAARPGGLENLTHDPLVRRLQKLLRNIRYRCENPRANKYRYYGGKGVRCLLTLEDLAYLWQRDHAEAMGAPSIDRLSAAGHYTRDNCRFIEHRENSREGGSSPKRPRHAP